MDFEFDGGGRFDVSRRAMDDYPGRDSPLAWRGHAVVQPTPAYRTLRLARRFPASAEQVFAAWLDPAVAGRWLFATASQPLAAVHIDPRVRGQFRLVDQRGGRAEQYSGAYLEIVPGRRLVFTLSMPCTGSALTRVTIDIARVGSHSRLTLVHDHVPGNRVNHVRDRWSGVLFGLGVTLDADFATGVTDRQST